MPEDEGAQEYISRRGREIGVVLKQAREQASKTLVECAREIGTYRQRYAAIERGEEPVGAAELERLATYLSIPAASLWSAEHEGRDNDRVVYVHTQVGESVHIVVGPYNPADREQKGLSADE